MENIKDTIEATAAEIMRLLLIPGSHYFEIPALDDPNEPNSIIRVSDHQINRANIYGPTYSFISSGFERDFREWRIDGEGMNQYGQSISQILYDELI